MTDLEISTALALAIGWEPTQMLIIAGKRYVASYPNGIEEGYNWTEFDYRNWAVIGPIAEKYKMFPQPYMNKWNVRGWSDTIADTPQKAIALAVIGATK